MFEDGRREPIFVAVEKDPANARQYGFNEFTVQLNELPREIHVFLPPTDSRLRSDIRYLENAEARKAEFAKKELEQVSTSYFNVDRIYPDSAIALFEFTQASLVHRRARHIYRQQTLAHQQPILAIKTREVQRFVFKADTSIISNRQVNFWGCKFFSLIRGGLATDNQPLIGKLVTMDMLEQEERSTHIDEIKSIFL